MKAAETPHRKLGDGYGLVEGHVVYSAAWLNEYADNLYCGHCGHVMTHNLWATECEQCFQPFSEEELF